MNDRRTASGPSPMIRVIGLWVVGMLLSVAAVVAGPGAGGIPEQRLAAAAERYDAASWPAGPRRAGVPVASLGVDGYTGGAIEFFPPAPITRRFADGDGVDRVLVEVSVRETVGGARAVLLEYLASVNSLVAVPRAETLGVAVGDLGYLGRAPGDRIAWIAFIRGNIAVRVVCLDPQADPHPEMAMIATALDRQIPARPLGPAAGTASGRIALEALTPARAACRAGETVALELRASGPLAAVDWVVGGPGQGYVEQDETGAWLLHTTGAGTIELACHVLGPSGFTASMKTTVEVGED